MEIVFSDTSREVLREWARSFDTLARMHNHDSDSELSDIMNRAANGQAVSQKDLYVIHEIINQPCDIDEDLSNQRSIVQADIIKFMSVDG